MVDRPHIYKDILSMIYDYFSDDQTEDIFYGAHDISAVVVL